MARLAETDALHDTLSGASALVFGHPYARLAFLSVVHSIHLRGAAGYRARRQQ